VPRLLAILLGVVFLVLEILRAEKVKHGLLPAPDGLGPTVVATPPQALALGLLWPLGVMIAGASVIAGRDLSPAMLMNAQFVITVAAFLPPAFLTCLRRIRLGAGRVPSAPAAVGLGLKFACIAMLVVVPVQLLWVVAVHARGVPLEVQGLVQKFAQPDDAAQPWVIAVFGTLVAPFTEEGVFRGLLYPALRGRTPGGPFMAAVLVSLLFAGIHGNLLAAVPLFALALVLTWVMESTNSLLACVVVHAVHNGLALAPMLWRHATGSS
jgi:membrane protease YdiL (CAAX protease family)